jgi:hypothetical protein
MLGLTQEQKKARLMTGSVAFAALKYEVERIPAKAIEGDARKEIGERHAPMPDVCGSLRRENRRLG